MVHKYMAKPPGVTHPASPKFHFSQGYQTNPCKVLKSLCQLLPIAFQCADCGHLYQQWIYLLSDPKLMIMYLAISTFSIPSPSHLKPRKGDETLVPLAQNIETQYLFSCLCDIPDILWLCCSHQCIHGWQISMRLTYGLSQCATDNLG